jgi:hypothetical protein
MGHGLVCASPLLAPVCLMLSICFSNVIVHVYYSCFKIKLKLRQHQCLIMPLMKVCKCTLIQANYNNAPSTFRSDSVKFARHTAVG